MPCRVQGPDTVAPAPQQCITAQGTQGDTELRVLLSLASQAPQLAANPEVMSMLLRTLTMKLQQNSAPTS